MNKELLLKRIDALLASIKEVGLRQDLLSSQNKFNNYYLVLSSYRDKIIKQ